MFDPKRFDPLSPSLRRLLDQQEKRDRMLHVDRLSERYAWMTKFGSPLFQATLAPSPVMGMLASIQRSQDRLTALASRPSMWTDVYRLAPRLSQAEGPHRMLERLLATPLAGAMQKGGLKNLGSISRIVSAEQFVMGRLAWANDFTPHAVDFLAGIQERFERLKARDRQLDVELKESARLFQQDGWYITPVLYYSDILLPGQLLAAHQQGQGQAVRVLIGAMQQVRDELQGSLRDKLSDLGLEEDQLQKRRASIEEQFNLALDGKTVSSVAGFMVAEAEGLFNDVMRRLGLEKGCFYTRDPEKVELRHQKLDGLHRQLKPNGRPFDEEFTRRDLRMFNRNRDKTIPKRNEAQHGELGHRSQESALWACSFLMLTVEYLSALNRLISAGDSPSTPDADHEELL